ncbi:response regulator [Geobacter sp. DSM 9736]|uniref:response regulator n=1 Tax=Geobacter sp. DSM 9736 TaxID=1277350 RepID=UPI000B514330|nr:response regulator [Geobacter sp. DSM 9736]SNB44750.1 response regulator receiver protein [Geobacter sp. DSM 9736]
MNSGNPGRTMEILLVEDNEADAFLMQEVLKETPVRTAVHLANDGEEGLDFLHRRGSHVAAPRPDLVILDLNLPRKDGRELLAEVKRDPELKTIPIVVLTTSESEEDIMRSYMLHANCYITKPVGITQLFDMVKSMEDFWFGIAKLPPSR